MIVQGEEVHCRDEEMCEQIDEGNGGGGVVQEEGALEKGGKEGEERAGQNESNEEVWLV